MHFLGVVRISARQAPNSLVYLEGGANSIIQDEILFPDDTFLAKKEGPARRWDYYFQRHCHANKGSFRKQLGNQGSVPVLPFWFRKSISYVFFYWVGLVAE